MEIPIVQWPSYPGGLPVTPLWHFRARGLSQFKPSRRSERLRMLRDPRTDWWLFTYKWSSIFWAFTMKWINRFMESSGAVEPAPSQYDLARVRVDVKPSSMWLDDSRVRLLSADRMTAADSNGAVHSEPFGSMSWTGSTGLCKSRPTSCDSKTGCFYLVESAIKLRHLQPLQGFCQ